jgi:hypothetical protein
MTSQPSKEKRLDETAKESFPASDPPASTGITGPGKGSAGSGPGETEPIPTGHPHSDRYATETAHHTEEDVTSTEDSDQSS